MNLRERLKPKPLAVKMPDLEHEIYLRQWTAAERRDFFEWTKTADNNNELVIRVALLSLSDEKGDRYYKDEDKEEVAQVSAVVLEKIMDHVMNFNMMTTKNVEEAKKKSETIPS